MATKPQSVNSVWQSLAAPCSHRCPLKCERENGIINQTKRQITNNASHQSRPTSHNRFNADSILFFPLSFCRLPIFYLGRRARINEIHGNELHINGKWRWNLTLAKDGVMGGFYVSKWRCQRYLLMVSGNEWNYHMVACLTCRLGSFACTYPFMNNMQARRYVWVV